VRHAVVTIYTDGACEPNPGAGGWAAILRYGTREMILSGADPQTTNNRMELQAAISALEALCSTPLGSEPYSIELYTDSRYLQQGITVWLPNWIARNWRKSDRQPVLNADLWQKLRALTSERDIRWHWLRGHAGQRHNERANRLANEAMRRGMRSS
jgi:ribonuclease HI